MKGSFKIGDGSRSPFMFYSNFKWNKADAKFEHCRVRCKVNCCDVGYKSFK